jgi:uncharacterized repeat protein (TIGR03803 family)
MALLLFAALGMAAQNWRPNPNSEAASAASRSGAVPSPASWTLGDIYDFQGAPDGYTSTAGLVADANANLYGTTLFGGPNNPNCLNSGCGTAFELSPNDNGTWTETVLHSFNASKSDGCTPFAGLTLDSAGNLYGTTQSCGTHGLGTVYKLSPGQAGSWTFSLLHSFGGSKKDGAVSDSTLLMDANGNLYGTTVYGGSHPENCQNAPLPNGCGTVFELTPGPHRRWTEQVLYSFAGGSNDGAAPSEGVAMDTQGSLYGVTKFGGPFQGTVYQLTPGQGGLWQETVLHKFPTGDNDGTYPRGIPAIDSQGNLFGTTSDGGEAELGTIWEVSPSGGTWTETVLYSFAAGGLSEPNAPYAGVVLDENGRLYGTTVEGGSGCEGFGCGSVYRFSPKTGKLKELIDFGKTTTNSPESSLLLRYGVLFGTTAFGGAVGDPNCQGVLQGCGSVYAVSQVVPLSDSETDVK